MVFEINFKLFSLFIFTRITFTIASPLFAENSAGNNTVNISKGNSNAPIVTKPSLRTEFVLSALSHHSTKGIQLPNARFLTSSTAPNTKLPSHAPSLKPSPSRKPTKLPTFHPTFNPTKTTFPIRKLTLAPKRKPSLRPSSRPSTNPPSVKPTATATEPSSMAGFTALHNALRVSVSPPANPSEVPLKWSSSLANSSQSWANNCIFDHGGFGVDILDEGQNIFASFGLHSSTVTEVMSIWGNYEKDYYDYQTNSCLDSIDCSHYTQIIWAATTLFGCGVSTCTQNNPFGDNFQGYPWLFWVCNYNPAGNTLLLIGQNYIPELPYST